MTDFRIDEYSCTNLCTHYNYTNMCNRGYFLTVVTESGTCTSQFEGTRLSFKSCRFDYINSSKTQTFSSTARPFKVIAINSLDKYSFPITIRTGINDLLKVTMDGVTQIITLNSGTDLLPLHIADEIQFKLRQYSIYTSFFRSRCEYVNNKFEISSTYVSDELIVHKEGSANLTLGFSIFSNTIGSGVSHINTGSGVIGLSQAGKEVWIQTSGQDHEVSMSTNFGTVPSGNIQLKYTPYSDSHLVVKLSDSTRQKCHVINDSTNTTSMYRSFTTTTGFYLESLARYPTPDSFTDITKEMYEVETRLCKDGTFDNLFRYFFSRDYYYLSEKNFYIPSHGGWNTIKVIYNPTVGYINLRKNDEFIIGLQDPLAKTRNFPTVVNEGIDKIRYQLSREQGDFFLDSFQLYSLDYEDLVSLDDYSTTLTGTVPSGWTVTSGDGSVYIDYDFMNGGKVVELSGTSSYMYKLFTSADTIRTGFCIYIPTSASGSSIQVALMNDAVNNLTLLFDGDQEVKYNGANSLPNITTYIFDSWYYLEIMPNCPSGIFNFGMFGDPENLDDRWKFMNRGHTMPLLDINDIDTIKFTVISGGPFYINSVRVEDLDLNHDNVLSDNFDSYTINEPPSDWTVEIGLPEAPNPVYPNEVIVTNNPSGPGGVVSIRAHKKDSSFSRTFSNRSRVRINYKTYLAYNRPFNSVLMNNSENVVRLRDEDRFGGIYSKIHHTHTNEAFEAHKDSDDYYSPFVINRNVWYNRDIIIDCDSSEFSYYHNWEIFGRRERLIKHFDSVNTIKFSGQSDYIFFNPSLYVDDVSVCGIDDLLDEDFNGMVLNSPPVDWSVSGTVNVISNPSNGGKVIKIEDPSITGFTSIYRSFESTDFLILKFKIMTESQGLFELRVGDSDDGSGAVLRFSSLDNGNHGFGYAYLVGYRGGTGEFFNRTSSFYNNETGLYPYQFYAIQRRNEWYDIEIHACITPSDDIGKFQTIKINGNAIDFWSEGKKWVFKKGLPKFDDTTKFDYIEITTLDSWKNKIYIKDICIQKDKKGVLVIDENFQSDNVEAPPLNWTLTSGGGSILVERREPNNDYSVGLSFWSGIGVSDLKFNEFNNLNQSLVNDTSYDIKLDFNTGAETYDLTINNIVKTTDRSFYLRADGIDTLAIANPTFSEKKKHFNYVGIDDIKVYDFNEQLIFSDDFQFETINNTPTFWNTLETLGTIRISQTEGAPSIYFGNMDDIYTVAVVNGSQVLVLDSYEDETLTYAEKSFGDISDGSIYIDVLMAVDFEENRYAEVQSFDGDSLVKIKFDYNSSTVQFFDEITQEWLDFSVPLEWEIFRWYNIQLYFNIEQLKCDIYIDSIFKDTVRLITLDKPANKIKFYKNIGHYPNDEDSFCIGKIETEISGSLSLFEDWSSYDHLQPPTGISNWVVSGTQVRVKQNPYFVNEGVLINTPNLISEDTLTDNIEVYGDWVSTTAKDFYVTMDTTNGRKAGPLGRSASFTVSGVEAINNQIEILYYDYPYRITKDFNSNGDIYIRFPREMEFNSGSKFKIHCDANNIVSGLNTGIFRLLFSSNKGDYSTNTFLASGTFDLGSKGLVVLVNDDLTYNSGDKFYFDAYTSYPDQFDVGNDIQVGSIRIGERSNIKCVKFNLKNGTHEIDEGVGINTLSWPITRMGNTKISFAFTNNWPYRQVVYGDFEFPLANATFTSVSASDIEKEVFTLASVIDTPYTIPTGYEIGLASNITNKGFPTSDWSPIFSGSDHFFYRDSMKFDKLNYIFFYILIDEENKGVGSIQCRYYYETGENI